MIEPGSPLEPRGADRALADPDSLDPGVVGILALQGSFHLHRKALERLGAPTRLVRLPEHLDGLSGLVIPGGESTVMSLLARKYDLFEALRDAVRSGLPALGTCAGAILLGQGDGEPPCLGVAPIRLERNAYGSQIESFAAELRLELFPGEEPFHGVFIRAPVIIESDEPGVQILGRHDGRAVLARAGAIVLATFHPELTDDLRLHRYFLTLCRRVPGVLS